MAAAKHGVYGAEQSNSMAEIKPLQGRFRVGSGPLQVPFPTTIRASKPPPEGRNNQNEPAQNRTVDRPGDQLINGGCSLKEPPTSPSQGKIWQKETPRGKRGAKHIDRRTVLLAWTRSSTRINRGLFHPRLINP